MKAESHDTFFITGRCQVLQSVRDVARGSVDADSGAFSPRGEHGSGDTLASCGISAGSTVFFWLSSFSEEVPDANAFFINDVVPSVQQTPKGISMFLSSLYVLVSSVLLFTELHWVFKHLRRDFCSDCSDRFFTACCVFARKQYWDCVIYTGK